MGLFPRCYKPSFVEIGRLVSEMFEGFFFTIYERGGHLGHVTQMPRTNFRNLYPWRLQTKFGFDWLRRCLKLSPDGRPAAQVSYNGRTKKNNNKHTKKKNNKQGQVEVLRQER